MTRRLTTAFGIAGLYLLVTSNLQASNLVVSVFVGSTLAALLPGGRALRPAELPRAMVAGLQHAATLVWDVLLNGVIVARMVAGGRRAICPGFVRLADRHDRELASALEAHAITISPGTMVIDFEGEREDPGAKFEVHCLDTRRVESEDDSTQRARVVAAVAGAKAAAGPDAGGPAPQPGSGSRLSEEHRDG
ncbi:MAG: Na+/H+ antiporter subunit E [Planctomycetota bacterium]